MNTLIAITSIYLFIFIGYFFKKVFKNQIDEKTLILLSVYFLQPILTFWGLTRVSLNHELLYVPIIYLAIILSVLILRIFIYSNNNN